MGFNVGDFVRVIDRGNGYPLYKDWIKENCPRYLKYWKENKEMKDGNMGVVLHVAPHGRGNDTLHLVRKGDIVYVMGQRSIELINSFTVELI